MQYLSEIWNLEPWPNNTNLDGKKTNGKSGFAGKLIRVKLIYAELGFAL